MNICSWCCHWLDVYGLLMITNLDPANGNCNHQMHLLHTLQNNSLLSPELSPLLGSSSPITSYQFSPRSPQADYGQPLVFHSLVAQLLKSSHNRTTFVNQVVFFMVAFLFQRPSSIEGDGNCSITLHILSSSCTPFQVISNTQHCKKFSIIMSIICPTSVTRTIAFWTCNQKTNNTISSPYII